MPPAGLVLVVLATAASVALANTLYTISAGNSRTCMNIQGRPVCWGDGQYGALGRGSLLTNYADKTGDMARISPIALPPYGYDAGMIVSGYGGHTCVLVANNGVCFGRNDFGQCGISNSMVSMETVSPVYSLPLLSNGTLLIDMVALGLSTTCVLDRTGKVYCIGGSSVGALGNGRPDTVMTLSLATAIPFSEPTVTANFISSKTHHSCAVFTNKRVRCWGKNDQGQLGQGHSRAFVGAALSDMSSVGYISFSDTTLEANTVHVGGSHSCVVFIPIGRIICWGAGDAGQTGADSTAPRGLAASDMSSVPLITFASTDPAMTMAASLTASCGLFQPAGASGWRARCWGSGANYQIGTDSTDNLGDQPGEMSSIPYIGFTELVASISGGVNHFCATFAGDRARCWGSGASGALGYDSTVAYRATAAPYIAIPAFPSATPIPTPSASASASATATATPAPSGRPTATPAVVAPVTVTHFADINVSPTLPLAGSSCWPSTNNTFSFTRDAQTVTFATPSSTQFLTMLVPVRGVGPFGARWCPAFPALVASVVAKAALSEVVFLSGGMIRDGFVGDIERFQAHATAIKIVTDAVRVAGSRVTETYMVLGPGDLKFGVEEGSVEMQSLGLLWRNAGWLPRSTAENQLTWDKGGYYSVRSPRLGVVIVGLNTVMWSQDNQLYQAGSPLWSDPAGQFIWLETVLRGARQSSTKVVLLGSVPPGVNPRTGELWLRAQYNTNLVSLMDLYSDVIASGFFSGMGGEPLVRQFAGLYGDTAPLFFAPPVTPLARGWAAGVRPAGTSLAASGTNPSVKIYSLMSLTGAVDDAVLLAASVDSANIDLSRGWLSFTAYSLATGDLTSAYLNFVGGYQTRVTFGDVTKEVGFGPWSWRAVIAAVALSGSTGTTFQQYLSASTVGAHGSLGKQPCDASCHATHACSMVVWDNSSTSLGRCTRNVTFGVMSGLGLWTVNPSQRPDGSEAFLEDLRKKNAANKKKAVLVGCLVGFGFAAAGIAICIAISRVQRASRLRAARGVSRTASKRKPATPASRNQNAPQRIQEFSEDEHTSLTDISLDVSTKSDQDRVVPPQTTQSGRKPTAPAPPPDVPMPTLKPVDLGEPQEVGLEAVL